MSEFSPKHPRLASILRAADVAIESFYTESRVLLVACNAPSQGSDMRHIESAYIEAQAALAKFRVVLDGLKEQNI